MIPATEIRSPTTARNGFRPMPPFSFRTPARRVSISKLMETSSPPNAIRRIIEAIIRLSECHGCPKPNRSPLKYMSCQGTCPKKRWLSTVSVRQPTRAANHEKKSAGTPRAGARKTASHTRTLRIREYPARNAATAPVPTAAPPNSVFDRIASALIIPAPKSAAEFLFRKKTINNAVAPRRNVLPSSPPKAYAIR